MVFIKQFYPIINSRIIYQDFAALLILSFSGRCGIPPGHSCKNDLIEAVRAENPDIQQFECSVFNGVYVTKDVDQGYLDFLDTLRNDDAKAVQRQNEVENLEMHNEG